MQAFGPSIQRWLKPEAVSFASDQRIGPRAVDIIFDESTRRGTAIHTVSVRDEEESGDVIVTIESKTHRPQQVRILRQEIDDDQWNQIDRRLIAVVGQIYNDPILFPLQWMEDGSG